MKKVIRTLILSLLPISSVFAQFNSIDLNTYKITDYKYKSLSTGLGFNNSETFQKANAFSNKSNLDASGNLDFFSTNQTRTYSSTHSIGFGTGINIREDDNNTNDIVRKAYGLYLNAQSSNKYYKSNNFFYGITFNTDQYASHSELRMIRPNKSKQYSNNYYADNSIRFSFGKGRIENATDARLAIYILDDLLKQGRITKNPTQDEVFQFADFITKLLNKRELDSRIKRIKEYEEIDSYLKSNGYITNLDGLAFGLINDNWIYARTQYWGTGSVFSFNIEPSFDYNNSFYKWSTTGFVDKYRIENKRYGLDLNLSYNNQKIKGLNWIYRYFIIGGVRFYRFENAGLISYNNYEEAYGRANYSIDYIPNTRTLISLTTGFDVLKNLSKDYNKETNLSPFVSTICNYYFSEKLRLSLDASARYNFNKNYDPMYTDKKVDFGISATLSYYIF